MFQHTRVLLIILGLLAFADVPMRAQHLFVETITEKDGLREQYTSHVMQDRRGFLWMAGHLGLERYDGYRFERYDRVQCGFPTNLDILNIEEDANGLMWVSFGMRHLWKVALARQPQALFILNPATKEALSFEDWCRRHAPELAGAAVRIIDVSGPREGYIYVALKDGRILGYDGQKFQALLRTDSDHIHEDDRGQFWVSKNDTLSVHAPDGRLLRRSICPAYVANITQVGEQEVQVLCVDHLLQSCSIEAHPVGGGPSRRIWSHKESSPAAMCRLNGYSPYTGHWYVGWTERLFVLDAKGSILYDYQHGGVEQGLSSPTTFFSAKDGLAWVSSHTGVLGLALRPDYFRYHYKTPGKLLDVRGIQADAKGQVHFVCRQFMRLGAAGQAEGLSAFDALTGHLYRDERGRFWMGSFEQSKQVRVYDPASGALEHLFNPAGVFTNAFFQWSPGDTLWLGQSHGLACASEADRLVYPFLQYGAFPELKELPVKFFYRQGSRCWLATGKGLYVWEKGRGITACYDGAFHPKLNADILHINAGADGRLWLSTKGGGLLCWEIGTPNINCYNTANGLGNDVVYASYQDARGYVWFSTDGGLMRLSPGQGVTQVFSTEMGLTHPEFNYAAHFQAADGRLYFGGLGGLLSFDPADFPAIEPSKARLEITGIQVLLSPSGKQRHVPLGTTLVWDTDVVYADIDFALLDFSNRSQRNYEYTIEGQMAGWSPLTQPTVRVGNLPYGEHILRIRGRNSLSLWSPHEVSISILVLRPYYAAWWFWAALALLLSFIIALIIRSRIYGLRRRNAQLAEQVADRTSTVARQAQELEQVYRAQSRLFTNMTHELRTPLTLVLQPLEQLSRELELGRDAREKLDMAKRNAERLRELANQLIDLAKLDAGLLAFTPKSGDVVRFVADVVQHFVREGQGPHLNFLSDLSYWHTPFAQDALRSILQNLLAHAWQYTPPEGEIRVVLRSEREGLERYVLCLEVSDNGLALSDEDLDRAFDRFYVPDKGKSYHYGSTAGIGLVLAKELVEKQGGQILIVSQAGQGTKRQVRLSLPSGHRIRGTASGPSLFIGRSAAPTSAEAPAERPEKDERIHMLIVDDNRDMRLILRQHFPADRFFITEAADGLAGLNAARDHTPDIIISDVMMPIMDGLEMLSALRDDARTSHIPVLLLTAKTDQQARLDGMSAGAEAYITKPYEADELTLQVDNFIRFKERLREHLREGFSEKNEDGTVGEELALAKFERQFLADLESFVRQNIDQPNLNGEMIAQAHGMNRMNLHRKLKSLLDMNATDFIRHTRLEEGRRLLGETEQTIAEIAYSVGFNSPSYFSSLFKDKYGMSPTAFRTGKED